VVVVAVALALAVAERFDRPALRYCRPTPVIAVPESINAEGSGL
jgi:hypothetical protein